MSNKPLNIGEEARVQMPMKTVASLIFLAIRKNKFHLLGVVGAEVVIH